MCHVFTLLNLTYGQALTESLRLLTKPSLWEYAELETGGKSQRLPQEREPAGAAFFNRTLFVRVPEGF